MNKTCPRGLRLAITLSRGQKMKISCPKGGFRTCSSIGGLRIFNGIAHSSPVPSALPSSKKRGKSVVDVVNQHRIFLWISQGKREQQTWRLALKRACGPTPSCNVCSSTDGTFTSKNIV